MKIDDSKMSSALRSRIRDLRATGENQYQCVMEFDAGFTGFEGHFEGHPIVPGVCLIEAARVVAEEVTGTALKTLRIANCRFRRPILADERADVKLKLADLPETGGRKIQAEFRVGEAVAAQLRLEAKTL